MMSFQNTLFFFFMKAFLQTHARAHSANAQRPFPAAMVFVGISHSVVEWLLKHLGVVMEQLEFRARDKQFPFEDGDVVCECGVLFFFCWLF